MTIEEMVEYLTRFETLQRLRIALKDEGIIFGIGLMPDTLYEMRNLYNGITEDLVNQGVDPEFISDIYDSSKDKVIIEAIRNLEKLKYDYNPKILGKWVSDV